MKRNTLLALTAIAVLAGAGWYATAQQADARQTVEQRLRVLEDKQAITETINKIAVYADRRQWDIVAAQFAPRVLLDYTSYATASAGTGQPQNLTPQQVVDAWQTVLPGYDYTQHQVTVHQITLQGDRATVTSNINATHFLQNAPGGDYWIFVGDYTHELQRTPQGWKVTRMRANLGAQIGNQRLSELATQRVKERGGK